MFESGALFLSKKVFVMSIVSFARKPEKIMLDLVKQTAKYPGFCCCDKYAKNYVFAGMASEWGELGGKLKKLYRDGGVINRLALAKELADYYWYVAAWYTENMAENDFIAQHEDPSYVEHKDELLPVDLLAIYCEQTECLMRGERQVNSINCLATAMDFTLLQIADIAYAKLMARLKHGTIKGNGDDR